MDKKKRNTLLLIASLGLDAAGIILLAVMILGEDQSNWILASALFCIILANLFNIIRIQLNKKD